jgi:hypothetical protein
LADDATPEAGNFCICFDCGFVGIYTGSGATLGQRKPTDEEAEEIAKHVGIQAVLRAWRLRKSMH